MSSAPRSVRPAYLVIREGGRWTDVFRLAPGRRITIGRASTNQVVVRDDRASRQHAELFERHEAWMLRDLSSRNGTRVDDALIAGDHPLAPGETITVAGCNMTFVRDIAEAFPSSGETGGTGPGACNTEERQTAEGIDTSLITHRRARAAWLRGDAGPSTLDPSAGKLFRLAYQLAQQPSVEDAAAAALSAVLDQTGLATGAVMNLPPQPAAKPTAAAPDQLAVVVTRHRPGRGYHRVPDWLAATVLREGEAVLARNLRADSALALPDSRGEMSTTATLLAPVRAEEQTLGLLHVYASEGDPPLDPAHLEFALAVADNLGLAWNNIRRQHQLATRLGRSRRRVDQLRQRLGESSQIIGESRGILEVRDAVRRVGPTSAVVLIRGESGTGKELVAAAVHDASPRRDGPFVCLNCAALSPTLLESELFGHEKGAFTGATERKIGKFEAADGGTLMLDEVGEMSEEVQAKFLRALEGHRFELVGGNQPIRTDVRVIAATNRDLEQAVRDGRFRADLYFRLRVVELRIPPLRERAHDVLTIAEHFLHRFCDETGRRLDGLSEAAAQRLLAYDWPGNIRELKNVIERAVVLGRGPLIDADDLLLSSIGREDTDAAPPAAAPGAAPIPLAELEQQHIIRTLRYTGGNKSKAASLLGIERSTLDRKLKRYRIDARQWQGEARC